MTLTDAQLVTLSAASQRDDHLLPRPERLRGTAADKLRTTLVGAALAEEVTVLSDAPHWREDEEGARVGLRITEAGLAALGLDESTPPSGQPEAVQEAVPGQGTAAEPVVTKPAPERAPRPGSKQALVLGLLSRAQGATLDELVSATGWLPHTTRAALTGLRQKGHTITRDRGPDGISSYRLIGR